MFRRLNTVVVLMTTSSSPFSTVALFAAAAAWQTVSKEFHYMKKALMCALLGAALACSGTALYAQMAEGSGQGGQHQMPSPEMRLQHMTQMLNLTPDQQAKIKPILENEAQQMQTLHQDTSMQKQDKMAKMREIRQSTMSQINPILTTEQQQKMQQMHEEHMQHGHGGAMGGQPPASQPPQQ